MSRAFKISFATVVIYFANLLWAQLEVSFRSAEIAVGPRRLKVEVAENEAQRSRGLMNRRHLSDKEGMLFVFPEPQKVSFWMKDTLIPLAIGFFDKRGKLLEIQEMSPPQSALEVSLPHYDSPEGVLMALEVPGGWFKRKGLKVGDRLKWLTSNEKRTRTTHP